MRYILRIFIRYIKNIRYNKYSGGILWIYKKNCKYILKMITKIFLSKITKNILKYECVFLRISLTVTLQSVFRNIRDKIGGIFICTWGFHSSRWNRESAVKTTNVDLTVGTRVILVVHLFPSNPLLKTSKSRVILHFKA